VQAHEDLFDEVLLLGREMLADAGIGDVPVVVDLGAEFVVEGEAQELLLFAGERLVERGDEGLAGGLGGRRRRSVALRCLPKLMPKRPPPWW